MPNTTLVTPCPASQHGDRTAIRRYGCVCRTDKARYDKARSAGLAHLVTDPLVNVVGSRRRIHALYAMGWTQAELARRLGYARGKLDWMLPGQRRIRASTAREVAVLTDELWDKNGPNRAARERARKQRENGTGGYLMMAWEGIDIDDPDASPCLDAAPEDFPEEERDASTVVDLNAVIRTLSGHPPVKRTKSGTLVADLRDVDRNAVITVLVGRGYSSLQIGTVTRIPARTVERNRILLGLRNRDLDAERRRAAAESGVALGVGRVPVSA